MKFNQSPYPLKKKVEVLLELDTSDITMFEIAKRDGIDPNTIGDWVNDKDKILAKADAQMKQLPAEIRNIQVQTAVEQLEDRIRRVDAFYIPALDKVKDKLNYALEEAETVDAIAKVTLAWNSLISSNETLMKQKLDAIEHLEKKRKLLEAESAVTVEVVEDSETKRKMQQKAEKWLMELVELRAKQEGAK